MQMLGTGATALQGIAAHAWGFFGFRFGKSGKDRISMDRGSAVLARGPRGAPRAGLDRWETLKTKIAILDHDEHVF